MTNSFRRMGFPAISLAILSVFIAAGPQTAQSQDSAARPDNSAQNKGQGPTADNQSNAKTDRDTTAGVRKALMADKSLSVYAHNIKIITQNGTVTLKGPVKSDDEKQKVESDAASVVARDNIVDQLTVKQ